MPVKQVSSPTQPALMPLPCTAHILLEQLQLEHLNVSVHVYIVRKVLFGS